MNKITKGMFLAALAIAAGCVAFVPRAYAADLTVAPAVIDGNGVPNDIFNYTLTVTNTSGRVENVFTSVYELTANGAQTFTDPASSDRPALLADWISISRGAMLFAPGETKSIPVSVTINPYAAAGDYHAVIGFVEGGTRAEAETHLAGAPQALVNFSVASNLKEELQLDGFGPAKRVSSGFPATIGFTIRNTGSLPSTPGGEVIFYNRIGHELGSVPANPDGVSIAPGASHSFTVSWDGNGAGMGEYKAGLQIAYGAANAQLADTALFWILPWKELLAIFFALLVVVVIASMFIHREYTKRHHRRRQVIERLINERSHKTIDLKHPHHDR